MNELNLLFDDVVKENGSALLGHRASLPGFSSQGKAEGRGWLISVRGCGGVSRYHPRHQSKNAMVLERFAMAS
jgi:hypothetical protein